MRIKRFTLVVIILLATVVNVGCSQNTYKLTVNDPSGLLIDSLDRRYESGENVTVKTVILYDADIVVYLDGVALEKATPIKTGDEYAHWEFYFEMPEHDATLTLEVGEDSFRS